ncbi:MAG: PHP domain-containing protein [Clostridia bacterium]|nr:PHP domain-containing protein [Clostridia bacterium]
MPKCEELLEKCGNLCDLHAHTHFSDGSLSPTELVKLAESVGLGAIALTDHNSIAGVPELLIAAREEGIHAIPGIEFSTDFRGTELHVIALGVTEDMYERINALVDGVREEKRLAMDKLISDLIAAGYKIEPERIYSGVKGIVNRAHVATELVRCGYATDRSDAFERILYSGGPFYKEPKYTDTVECISFIKSLGAVSVLAHPFLNIDEATLRELLDLTRGSLDAIEVIYSEYDDETTELSRKIADEYGLLYSGGSDFHGKNKPDIGLGCGKGNLRIPLSFAEKMNLLEEKL